MKLLAKTLIISSLLLGACAQQSGYTPTVDTYNNPNAHRTNQDLKKKKELAQRAAGDTMQEAAIGGAVGGVAGAATGAAAGAIYGDEAATGAWSGAAIGAVSGAAIQGYQSDDKYKKAYANCMRNRGHNVVE